MHADVKRLTHEHHATKALELEPINDAIHINMPLRCVSFGDIDNAMIHFLGGDQDQSGGESSEFLAAGGTKRACAARE